MECVSTFCCASIKKTDFYTNFYRNERQCWQFVYMDKLAQTLHYIKVGVKNADK